MKLRNTIELLEARIAPAATLTFTDVDGDIVTIKTSKRTSDDLAAGMHVAGVGANGYGNADDTVAAGDDLPSIVAIIRSITIGGTVTGTAAAGIISALPLN